MRGGEPTPLLGRLDRFEPRAVSAFERLFGVALLVEIATQVRADTWGVHAGRLYPWRHLGILPLYPPAVLALEWTIASACGVILLAAPRRSHATRSLAWRILAPVLLVSVLERFSNHGVLFFLVAFFTSMNPPDADAPDFAAREHPNLGLVRAQLVVVYVFSALAKLLHGFTSGASLRVLIGLLPPVAAAASWVVVVGELLLPLLLWKRPAAGIAAVVLVHAAFAYALPNVASFGVVMVALAVLFAGTRAR